MRSFGLLILAHWLTIFGALSSAGASPQCSQVFPESGPQGKLLDVSRQAGGSTGGKWVKDENGVNWFLKRDVYYSELQTSAEAISSQIYRHFGYTTPETVKVIVNGVHFSASKDIGESHQWTDFSNRNTTEIRQMRIVAAYLKDWDRLGNPANNRDMPDGSLVILDFGGTLGSRAQGRHKPGPVFNDAIGSFESTTDVNVIYGSFAIQASANHPWMKITRDDAQNVIEKFKTLTDEKIVAIVKSARYSDPKTESAMIQALETRRNGIIENLLSLFPEDL